MGCDWTPSKEKCDSLSLLPRAIPWLDLHLGCPETSEFSSVVFKLNKYTIFTPWAQFSIHTRWWQLVLFSTSSVCWLTRWLCRSCLSTWHIRLLLVCRLLSTATYWYYRVSCYLSSQWCSSGYLQSPLLRCS